MKLACSFCKTEYVISPAPTTAVQCTVCGNVWVPEKPNRKSPWLVLIASVCALLAAVIFTFVIVTQYQATSPSKVPLLASVSGIHTVVDAFGEPHFVVSGKITNQTEQVYGVPDLMVISRDASGNILHTQKFLPVVTLLDAGASVEFSHTLSTPTTDVRKVTIELRQQ